LYEVISNRILAHRFMTDTMYSGRWVSKLWVSTLSGDILAASYPLFSNRCNKPLRTAGICLPE